MKSDAGHLISAPVVTRAQVPILTLCPLVEPGPALLSWPMTRLLTCTPVALQFWSNEAEVELILTNITEMTLLCLSRCLCLCLLSGVCVYVFFCLCLLSLLICFPLFLSVFQFLYPYLSVSLFLSVSLSIVYIHICVYANIM